MIEGEASNYNEDKMNVEQSKLVPDSNDTPENDLLLKNDMTLDDDQVHVEHKVLTNDIYHEDEEEGREEKGEEPPGEEADEPYRMLPRERPFSLAQLVKRAHDGLGHPFRDRFIRILKEAKASPEALQAARSLKCATCEKHAKLHPHRAAAPPRQLQFNQVVGVDTLWLPGPEPGGKTKMALNVIDWATRFQMVLPLKDHTPRSARLALLQWIRVFGL